MPKPVWLALTAAIGILMIILGIAFDLIGICMIGAALIILAIAFAILDLSEGGL